MATPVSSPDNFRPGFELTKTAGLARRGRLRLFHGEVETPVFMPVGTAGTVKGITPDELTGMGAQIILSNTYHLFLRPGVELIEELGGLHRFMGWDKPILTDSGGYQVYSLESLRKLDDTGVEFKSHLDGSTGQLTPERVIDIQERLGSDIMMVLDECPPHDAPEKLLDQAIARTSRWAERSLGAWRKPHLALFGIVQGAADVRRRVAHAEILGRMELDGRRFDGLAIGGLGLGEGETQFLDTVEATAQAMDPVRPRYLMGIGRPEDILNSIERGVDMFDCVIPTRNGRNGQAFTSRGVIKIKNLQYRNDPRPLDETCDCQACRNFSRAYLRHLYLADEMLAPRLLALHNLHFYQTLLKEARDAIDDGRFVEYKGSRLARMTSDSPD